MANDDWSSKPYAAWLEQCIRELVESNPVSIAMEMVGENGIVQTCYYDVSPNDRAIMIDAMRDDAREQWLRDCKDMILEILNDEDNDGLQENDPETDST